MTRSRVRRIRGAGNFWIEETTEAGVVTLTLRGELDAATVDELEDALSEAVGRTTTGVAVRIGELDFIGAVGFRCLEHANQMARARGRSFVVIANVWQLKIATVLSDLKLTIRVIEGPQGWKMAA